MEKKSSNKNLHKANKAKKDEFYTQSVDIEKELKSIDFIFHLAGSNRPKDIKEYYKVNTDLTKEIVDLLEKHSLKIPLLLASSMSPRLFTGMLPIARTFSLRNCNAPRSTNFPCAVRYCFCVIC